MTERKTFKTSFLKSVHGILSFHPVAWTNDLNGKILEILTTEKFTIEKGNENPMIMASKNNTAVTVSDNGIAYSLDIMDYVSFEHFTTTFLPFLNSLMKSLNITTIDSFMIQKVNSFSLDKELNGNPITEDTAYSALFSKFVTNQEPALLHTNDNLILNAQPSFRELDQSIIIKLVITSFCTTAITPDKFGDFLNSANDQMFDLWYNCMNKDLLEYMDK